MRKHFLILCTLFLSSVAFAAFNPMDISMTASVNKTALTTNEELRLTVTVDGAAGDFMPQLPSLAAFNVYTTSMAQQINNFHTVTTFEYIMLPRFPGKTVIGPVTLQYANKTYKTDPITVTVYRADQNLPSAAAQNTANQKRAASVQKVKPAPADMPPLERDLYNRAAKMTDKEFFMVAAVSNAHPYVNQTVKLVVRFYYSQRFLGQSPYTPPTISNLFMEDMETSEGEQIIGNKKYLYWEKPYALSGVTEGKASVGPASITYVSADTVRSAFNWGFMASSQEPETVSSNALTLNIRPVPTDGQPKTFYGAVGSGYDIAAELDRSQVEAGEAVNLTVKVSGSGNLKPTSDLILPKMAGFKIYDVASSSGAVVSNGSLKSYKIFKTVIVPIASGTYTIPALSWSYFDPSAKEYRTIRTQPISLQVSATSKTDAGFDFGTHTDLSGGFTQLGKDIHYLKSDLAKTQAGLWLPASQMTWINLLAAILLLAVGIFALSDKKTLNGKRAQAKAKAQLKKAWDEQTIADALSAYLQAKYGVNTSSMPLTAIAEALKKRGCPEPLVSRFASLWQRLDAARFAPVDIQGEGTHEIARQAAELIKAMDKGEYK